MIAVPLFLSELAHLLFSLPPLLRSSVTIVNCCTAMAWVCWCRHWFCCCIAIPHFTHASLVSRTTSFGRPHCCLLIGWINTAFVPTLNCIKIESGIDWSLSSVHPRNSRFEWTESSHPAEKKVTIYLFGIKSWFWMPTCQQTNPFSFISHFEDLITSKWISMQENKASPEWPFKGWKNKSALPLHLLNGEGGPNGNLHEVHHLARTFVNGHAAMSQLSQRLCWWPHILVLFCDHIFCLPRHYVSFGWCIFQSQHHHGLIWLASSLVSTPPFLIRWAHFLICHATSSCCQLPVS